MTTFNLIPREVPKVHTKHRRISTKIPVPESLEILEKIKKYESSNVMDQLPVIWDTAKDCYIYDGYGNIWIDFTSSIFVTNSGHGNNKIIERLQEQIDPPLLHSYSYATRIRADYLEKLIKFVPSYLEKASLFSSGTEATERAIKLARYYGKRFNPKRTIIVGSKGNFHGKTMGAQMVGGQDKDKEWIGYLDPDMFQLPFPYPWFFDKSETTGKDLFLRQIRYLEEEIVIKKISAFILESFQGWGAIFYPKDYIQELRKWTKERDILLIFDEIQAGFGRTGKLFGYQHYEVEPDLVICGKGVSGSLPLSVVLGRTELIELDPTYTSTHGGHPLACAAGLGNIEAFEEEHLIEEAQRKESIILKELNRWKELFPKRIGRILGKGMLFGIFITKENSQELDIDFTNRIVERAMEKGVFSICTGRGTIKLGPPLTISDEALIEGLKVYEESIKELNNGRL